MVDVSYYRRMFEKSDKVTVVFTPYDQLPLGTNGGAVSIGGVYNLPEDKAVIVYYELANNLADSASGYRAVNFVPPKWWTTGLWDTTEDAAPATSRLNLDSAKIDDTQTVNTAGVINSGTIDLTMISWDGSPETVRSAEGAVGSLPAGPATSPMQVVARVMTNQGILLTDAATDARFAGYYPSLQGTLTALLKQISTGLGVFIVYAPYTGATPGVLGTVRSTPTRIRLINPELPARIITESSYTPQAVASLYTSKRLVNQVIYAATQVINVKSGENQVIHVPTNGTAFLNSIIQPVAVTAIPNIPYNGPSSIYCINDSNGYEASGRWTALGGKITVTAGNTPDEIVLNITAPVDPAGLSFNLAEGSSHPALYISTADGVLWNKADYTINTGATPPTNSYKPPAQPPSLDNSLIISKAILWGRMAALAHEVGWPSLTMTGITFDSAELLGGGVVDPATMVNSIFRHKETMWRMTKCSWDSLAGYWTADAVWHCTGDDFVTDFGTMTGTQYVAYMTSEYGTMPTGEQAFYEPLRRAQSV